MGVKFSVAVVISALDRATAPIAKVQAAINRVRKPFGDVLSSVKKMSDAAGFPKLQSAASGASRAIGTLAGRLKTVALQAVATGAAIAAVTYGLARSFLTFGDEIGDTATKIGISAEKLQEWRFAAKLANVEDESLTRGLLFLSRNAVAASRGNKAIAETFERIGLQAFDANGRVLPLADLLPQIADRLKAIHDPAKRVATSMQLFGRGGAELIPMLVSGSKGIGDLAAEARRLGLVLSNETILEAGRMSDELEMAEMVIKSLKVTIGAALAPTIVDLAKKMSDWVVKNRPQIESLARAFAESLPDAIDTVVEAFKRMKVLMRPLIVLWDLLSRALGPAPALLLLIAGALTLSLIPSVLSTIGALYTLSAAMLSTPAGWVVLAIMAIVAALAAMVAGVVLAYQHWDKISQLFPHLSVAVEKFARIGLGLMIDQLGKILMYVDALIQNFTGVLGLADKFFEFLGFGPSIELPKTGALPGGPAQAPADRVGLAPPAFGAAAFAAMAGFQAERENAAKVLVDFQNMPRGTRVTPAPGNDVDLDLKLGYAMFSP